MTKEHEAERLDGTLIRGADGEMYFIPDQDLAAYKLPEQVAGPLRQELDEADVVGFSSRSPFDARLSDAIEAVSGIHGPLGRVDVPAPEKPFPSCAVPAPDLRLLLGREQ